MSFRGEGEIGPTLTFAQELIRIPSTTDNLIACRSALRLAKARLHGFPSRDFESNGVPSALIHNRQDEPDYPGKFRVILNGHLDVVPPSTPGQFKPHIDGDRETGRLVGRGAGDMKAATAVMIDVFRELADEVPYPLGLMLVTDEEVGGANGTGHQVREGVQTDFVIVGEPTKLGICYQMKGRLGVRVAVSSTEAHAAYGDERVDIQAADALSEFNVRVRQLFPKGEPDSWQTTAAITGLGTSNTDREGQVANTIPGVAYSNWDIRNVSDDTREAIVHRLRGIAGRNTTIEVVQELPAAFTDPQHPDIVALQAAIGSATGRAPHFAQQNGSCDFRYFTEQGAGGVAFGPVADNTHGEDESVDIRSLAQYRNALTTYLRSID